MNSVIIVTTVILECSVLVFGQNEVSPARPGGSEEYDLYNEHELLSFPSYGHNHPCKRECLIDVPMTCYYRFVVHYSEVAGKICKRYNNDPDKGCMLGDGWPGAVMLADRRLVEPIIEVCVNDTIVVDVVNNLREGTTIHWHGIHQRQTPHMDGSPFTTQYPINPGEIYHYKFEASQDGTFWWHSHMHFQRAYGLAGPLIIRRPLELDPHANLYDYDLTEHVIFLQDWFYTYTTTFPQNVIINGKGHNNVTQFHKKSSKQLINYERFRVVQAQRYRFRVIYNGNANCPLEISIDNHDMQVISSDAQDIDPVTVKSLIILAAERYDVVLYASQRIGNYWLRVKGHGFCARNQVHQAAIIQYEGASEYALPKTKLSYTYEPDGLQLNALDVGVSDNPNKLSMIGVNSLRYIEWENNEKFKTYYTSLGLFTTDNFFGFQMDDIFFDMPQISLMQARNLDIERFACNKSSLLKQGKHCKTELCRCFNLIQVPAYDYIEFVISAETAVGHPFHPHGIDFRVVGMGVLGKDEIKNIEQIDKAKPLPRRLDKSSAIKDTVQVPAYGYTIIRFYSDNPGYWMFHCHLTVHSEDGMMSVLKIGEHHQMVPTPRDNCHEYIDYKYKM